MVSRSVTAALDTVPFARLAQMGLPPRIRSLVEGVHHVAMPVIDSGLMRALDDLERDLLAHVDRTQHDDEQTLCMASLRELKKHRADFVHGCNLAIQRSLVALLRNHVAHDSLCEELPAEAELGGTREERTTLAQIAARAEIRAAAGLHELSFRLAVIGGTPPIELDALALGPQQLCTAICLGARKLDLSPAHRMSLFRRIDKCLFGDAAALYEAINRYLVEHRVFAHLQAAPRVRVEPQAIAPPAAEPMPPVAAVAPAAPAQPAPPALPPQTAPEDPAPAPEAARIASDAPLDLAFFRSLRETVAARRRALAAAEPAAERERPIADKGEILAALGVLQAQAPTPVMIGGKWANRSVAHIRQDLMNQLRSRHGGTTPRLRDEDSDTIEMIGLLFDRLLAPFPGNSNCQRLLARLQVPVLRVVLKDPGFFARRAHPARQMLETLCEALAQWIEDEDADRATIERLQGVVEHLLKEYREQLDAFEHAREEIERIVGALQKKAEIAERRQVEAARGREKLDLAQAAAEEAVRERLAQASIPRVLRGLLENAWTDSVALALLRQGVDHPKTLERLEVVDRLLHAFAQPPEAGRAGLEALRGVLEEGLSAIGFHEEAIAAAWSGLFSVLTAQEPGADEAAAKSMSTLLLQRPRLGGEARAGSDGGSESGAIGGQGGTGSPLPGEAAAAERIRQLPFGCWIEFARKPPAMPSRRRLCWYSAVTGRAVLLSPRGGKGEERSLDQLARELALGHMRVLQDERANLIDQAWREVMANQRSGGGSHP